MTARDPRSRAIGPLLLALILVGGCGRSKAVQADGQRLRHDAGFSVVVPEDWRASSTAAGVRLVARAPHRDGYPVIRIDVHDVGQLPDTFLEGRAMTWTGGQGSYRYHRWANPLGHGYQLDVDLASDRVFLTVEATLWDERLRRDSRYFRRTIWPIINSIAPDDGT